MVVNGIGKYDYKYMMMMMIVMTTGVLMKMVVTIEFERDGAAATVLMLRNLFPRLPAEVGAGASSCGPL